MSRVKKTAKAVKQAPVKLSEYVFSWDTVYGDIRKRVAARRQLAARLNERDLVDIDALMPFLKAIPLEVDSGMSKANREISAGLLEAVMRHPSTQERFLGLSERPLFWPLEQRKALVTALVECGALTALLAAPRDRIRATLMRALADKHFHISSTLHLETVQKLYSSTDLTITITAAQLPASGFYNFQTWLPLLLNLAADNRLFVAVSMSAPFDNPQICWPVYRHELSDWSKNTKLAMNNAAAMFVLTLLVYTYGRFSRDVARLLSPYRQLYELAFSFLERLKHIDDGIQRQFDKVVEYTSVATRQRIELDRSYWTVDGWVGQAMPGKCVATIDKYLSSLTLRASACRDRAHYLMQARRQTKSGLRACLFAIVVALQQSVVTTSVAPLAVYLVHDILLLARDPYVVFAHRDADADERAFVLAIITRACNAVLAIYSSERRQLPLASAASRLASELNSECDEHQVKRARQTESEEQE